MKNIWVFIALFGLMVSCNKKEADSNQNTSTSTTNTKIQTVEVVQPIARSFNAKVLVTGTAKANQTVMVYPMESGIITQINKDIGDKVSKGQIIARIANPKIEELVANAQSALAVGQANLKIKEAELIAAQANATGLASIAKRLSQVFESTPQLTTIVDVESAKAKNAEAQAMITNKKALIEAQIKMNEGLAQKLATAKKRFSFLNIVAPFSGIITQRFVDKGTLLQNGLNQSNPQPIVEIQETNLIRLMLPVPESDAVSIKKGMDTEITFPELSGKVYHAKVSRTSGVLDQNSKTMQVEIDIPNQDGKIISGMYAKALLQVGSRKNILSLPVQTKIRYQNETYVLQVDQNTVKRIPVKIGLSDAEYYEVLNPEISKNTLLITKGKGLVKPGQKVNAVKK